MTDSQTVSRSSLRQGVVYILVGLVWGLAIHSAGYPRLALGAHLQLMTHGVMFLVVGLLVSHLGLGRSGLTRGILIAGPWLTWPLILTEMANAWWGTHDILPLAAKEAGAPGAASWQELIVTVGHALGVLVMLIYWGAIAAEVFARPKARE